MKNQCDGCVLGYPVVGGIHVDLECKPYMVCVKHIYELSQLDKKILMNIANNLDCKPNEHVLRLMLRAYGYCDLSTSHGMFSFNTGKNETFWHLTELGYETIDNQ